MKSRSSRGFLAALVLLCPIGLANDIEYVICTEDDGTIHQAKGRIEIVDETVIVRRVDQPDQVFISMKCWTEDETVTPKGEENVTGK